MHVSDVVATVMQCLHATPARRTLDVVGPQALSPGRLVADHAPGAGTQAR
ncbi:MAG: hypothetical protein R3E89_03590 [Thiolinea sp.]